MSLRHHADLDLDALFADLRYHPHDGQRLVHQSTARRRIVSCGVRWGKSMCAAMEAIAAALLAEGRSIGWVVAPTYDLADRIYREVELRLLEHMKHRIELRKDSERRIVIRNISGGVSEIRAKSADNPDSLLGEGLDFVIVDEASRLKPRIWQNYLSQRLIDKDGWALLISTPKGKGYFYDLFRLGQEPNRDPDYASWNMPSWANPILDRRLIESERKRLPSAAFRQEFGAEFIEGSGSVFRNVRECATGEWIEPEWRQPYFGGLDLAKTEDFTVLSIINSRHELVYSDRFQRLDWSLQIARVRAALERYGGASVLVDSTGAGEPILESLVKEGVRAKPYPFTVKSKSALIDNLSLLFEQRTITVPTPQLWPEGIEELEAFQYTVSDNGHMRSGAPGGQHDDCVVSLALAAWNARSNLVQVRVTAFPRGRRSSMRWKPRNVDRDGRGR
jgi:hypothetical protein